MLRLKSYDQHLCITPPHTRPTSPATNYANVCSQKASGCVQEALVVAVTKVQFGQIKRKHRFQPNQMETSS